MSVRGRTKKPDLFRVTHRVVLRKRDKGYDLYHQKHGYQITPLSGMDAAELLFNLKDELRRTDLGRRCVDAVAAQRRKAL